MLDAAQRATAICVNCPLPLAFPQPPAQSWTQGLGSWCWCLSVSCLWRSKHQAFSADLLITQNGALPLSAFQAWAVQRGSPYTSPGITENQMLPPKLGCHKPRHYLHSPRWHKFKHPEGNGEIRILITKVTVTWVGALVECVKLWCIGISECVLGVFGLWSWKMPR